LELPSAKIEDGNFPGRHAGDIGDSRVWTDENFARLLGNVKGFDYL
jgi:hypothetical protein